MPHFTPTLRINVKSPSPRKMGGQHDPPKRRYSSARLHDVTSFQKIVSPSSCTGRLLHVQLYGNARAARQQTAASRSAGC